MKNMKIIRHKGFALLSCIILIYIFLASLQIRLPGPQVDEVKHGSFATMMLGMNLRGSVLQTISASFFNKDFPLMITSYESALESYFLLPFFLAFGKNIFVYRSCWVFYGAITLLFSYLFAKELFGKKRAMLFSFLLAINPTFLFGARLGTFSCITLLAANMAALFCLVRWGKGRSLAYFVCGIFLLGLSLSLRTSFIWSLGGILIVGLAFFSAVKKRISLERMNLKYLFHIFLGSLSFLFGYSFVIFYNISSRFETLKFVLDNLLKPQQGIEKLTYFYCLLHRISELRYFIRGEWFLSELGGWYNRPSTTEVINPIYWSIFLFSLAWFIYYIIRVRNNKQFENKNHLFLLVMISGTVSLSPFPCIPYALAGPRVFAIYLFLFLFVAVMLIDLAVYFKKKFLAILVITMILVLSFFELRSLAANHVFLNKTGGTGNFSDAIYELSDWLVENGHFRPRAVDWGFDHSLFILSQGKIFTEHIHRPTSALSDGTDYLLDFGDEDIRQGAIYLTHTDNFENLKGFNKKFREIIKQHGKTLIELKRFYQRDGKPIYVVYTVQ